MIPYGEAVKYRDGTGEEFGGGFCLKLIFFVSSPITGLPKTPGTPACSASAGEYDEHGTLFFTARARDAASSISTYLLLTTTCIV